MNDFVIYPGFLGKSQDFVTLSHALGSVEIIEPTVAYRKESHHLIGEITSELLPKSPRIGNRTGIGYSMGGRLLLQLAQKFPGAFDALVFISTNPGLRTESEKNARAEHDEAWAKKILENPWPEFIKSWNAQPVFAGTSNEVDRDEKHYDKEDLARQITNWSLSKQHDFRFYLRAMKTPFLWIAGERDSKFVKIAEEILPMAYLPMNGAGHRVHLDQPKELARIILNFATKGRS